MSKLRIYLEETGQSQPQFAELVGCDKSMISRLCNLAAKPGLDLAVAIQRETDGRVPAEYWVPDHRLRRPPAAQDEETRGAA